MDQLTVPGWIEQVLEGVQHLHAQHIAHRDIKLANLLLTSRGQVIDYTNHELIAQNMNQ